jgi:hypothetical protein
MEKVPYNDTAREEFLHQLLNSNQVNAAEKVLDQNYARDELLNNMLGDDCTKKGMLEGLLFAL